MILYFWRLFPFHPEDCKDGTTKVDCSVTFFGQEYAKCNELTFLLMVKQPPCLLPSMEVKGRREQSLQENGVGKFKNGPGFSQGHVNSQICALHKVR
jgi:hypothetical protein